MRKTVWQKWRNEIVFIPLAFITWMWWPSLIYFIDPTAGTLDSAYLQKVPFAIFVSFVYSFIEKLQMRIDYEEQDAYMEGADPTKPSFNEDFKKLTSWERIRATQSLSFQRLVIFGASLLAF